MQTIETQTRAGIKRRFCTGKKNCKKIEFDFNNGQKMSVEQIPHQCRLEFESSIGPYKVR